MLRGRIALAALILAAVMVPGSADVAAVATTADTLSTEQFRGVAGTRQIGPEFPHFAGREQTGSQAIYLVETDARSAMDALVERTRQLGFLQTPAFSPGLCSSAPYGDDPTTPGTGEARVLCRGRYARADRVIVLIDVTVCESCPDPTSTASVAIDRSPQKGEGPIPPLESISTTLDLSAAARRSVLRPTNASLVPTGFPQLRAARLAVPVVSTSDLCADTFTAALRIDGSPTRAFAAYSAQLFGTGRPALDRAIRRGRRLMQRSDGRARLTLLEGGTLRHAWMLASQCDPLLD
jgi:hypothetical protein